MLFFKVSHCTKSSALTTESSVKVNYLRLKALMQDTFVIRIICITLQSLCFGVEQSFPTAPSLPPHCLPVGMWQITGIIQRTALPCCCQLSSFSWWVPPAFRWHGDWNGAFSAACPVPQRTLSNSCLAEQAAVLGAALISSSGKQPKCFKGLCCRVEGVFC